MLSRRSTWKGTVPSLDTNTRTDFSVVTCGRRSGMPAPEDAPEVAG